MSNLTITPEERASWRERLENPFICHYSKHGAFTLRLLNALEAAEAERDKAAKYAGQCAATALAEAYAAESMRAKVAEVQSKLAGAEIRAEEAEARAERAEKEEGFLTAKLLQTGCLIIPHGSFFLENVPKIIARELQDLKAENARLTAERDWLVSWFDAHPCCMDLHCPFGRSLEQCEAREGGMLDSTECWQEAARRAVAGEGEVRE